MDESERLQLINKLERKLLIFKSKMIVKDGYKMESVYYDRAIQGVRTYLGDFEFFEATENDIEDAKKLLAAADEEDKLAKKTNK